MAGEIFHNIANRFLIESKLLKETPVKDLIKALRNSHLQGVEDTVTVNGKTVSLKAVEGKQLNNLPTDLESSFKRSVFRMRAVFKRGLAKLDWAKPYEAVPPKFKPAAEQTVDDVAEKAAVHPWLADVPETLQEELKYPLKDFDAGNPESLALALERLINNHSENTLPAIELWTKAGFERQFAVSGAFQPDVTINRVTRGSKILPHGFISPTFLSKPGIVQQLPNGTQRVIRQAPQHDLAISPEVYDRLFFAAEKSMPFNATAFEPFAAIVDDHIKGLSPDETTQFLKDTLGYVSARSMPFNNDEIISILTSEKLLANLRTALDDALSQAGMRIESVAVETGNVLNPEQCKIAKVHITEDPTRHLQIVAPVNSNRLTHGEDFQAEVVRAPKVEVYIHPQSLLSERPIASALEMDYAAKCSVILNQISSEDRYQLEQILEEKNSGGLLNWLKQVSPKDSELVVNQLDLELIDNGTIHFRNNTFGFPPIGVADQARAEAAAAIQKLQLYKEDVSLFYGEFPQTQAELVDMLARYPDLSFERKAQVQSILGISQQNGVFSFARALELPTVDVIKVAQKRANQALFHSQCHNYTVLNDLLSMMSTKSSVEITNGISKWTAQHWYSKNTAEKELAAKFAEIFDIHIDEVAAGTVFDPARHTVTRFIPASVAEEAGKVIPPNSTHLSLDAPGYHSALIPDVAIVDKPKVTVALSEFESAPLPDLGFVSSMKTEISRIIRDNPSDNAHVLLHQMPHGSSGEQSHAFIDWLSKVVKDEAIPGLVDGQAGDFGRLHPQVKGKAEELLQRFGIESLSDTITAPRYIKDFEITPDSGFLHGLSDIEMPGYSLKVDGNEVTIPHRAKVWVNPQQAAQNAAA